jgi:hypothetical protein
MENDELNLSADARRFLTSYNDATAGPHGGSAVEASIPDGDAHVRGALATDVLRMPYAAAMEGCDLSAVVRELGASYDIGSLVGRGVGGGTMGVAGPSPTIRPRVDVPPSSADDGPSAGDGGNASELPPHARRLLAHICGCSDDWRRSLTGPDYTLARLWGLAASLVSLMDCAGHDDALYELNGVRDIEQLLEGGVWTRETE